VDCLQDGFFRAHTVSVSLRILDASPAFKPNVQTERPEPAAKGQQIYYYQNGWFGSAPVWG
jgi:hypothetical protein